MLERQLREREEAHEIKLKDSLQIQEEDLTEKFETQLKWAKKEAEQLAARAQQEAAAKSSENEKDDLEQAKNRTIELEAARDDLQRSLEQALAEKATVEKEKAKCLAGLSKSDTVSVLICAQIDTHTLNKFKLIK
eukprot:SAG31_NODE_57_length_29727_cov_12.584568_29_plen_135_part_00